MVNWYKTLNGLGQPMLMWFSVKIDQVICTCYALPLYLDCSYKPIWDHLNSLKLGFMNNSWSSYEFLPIKLILHFFSLKAAIYGLFSHFPVWRYNTMTWMYRRVSAIILGFLFIQQFFNAQINESFTFVYRLFLWIRTQVSRVVAFKIQSSNRFLSTISWYWLQIYCLIPV